MRGRKILSVAILFSIVLIGSGVLASGLVDVPLKNVILPTAGPLSTAPVAVYPAYYFKDYLLQPVGSTFWVHVNVSSVTDLFTWQLNITWSKAITTNLDVLNVSRILTGNNATYILYTTDSVNKTASYQLSFVINATDNAKRNAGAADSILDNRAPPRGVSSTPWLRMVSIQFKVVGYGSCDLVISSTGTLSTTLLDSYGATIGVTATNGYFSNKATGDINGDRSVDKFDFGLFATAYLSTAGPPPSAKWNREADLNHDGVVDKFDFGIFAKNYLRSV